MTEGAAKPRDAAIAVAVRQRQGQLEVLWAKRQTELGFAGGFHAFPGGRVEPGDANLAMVGAEGFDRTLRVTAVRELFEETGILVSEGPRPTEAVLASARAELHAGKQTFERALERLGQRLRAEHLHEAGRWITPAAFPTRFDARLFLVEVPPDAPAPSPFARELSMARWVTPAVALGEWTSGAALLHPPILHALDVLSRFRSLGEAAVQMRSPAHAAGFIATRLEYQKGIRALPLLTPTLPPATHTNAYVLGNGDLLVVDPGADDSRECARLFALLEGLRGEGKRGKAIVLTHHHPDHVGGALRVKERLKLPVWCHAKTADRLAFPADRILDDGEVLKLSGTPPMRWRVLHTPGHTRGHLSLVEETTHATVIGDLVAGQGTVVIDPPEGDMTDYLAQLQRLQELPVRALFPGHGPPLPDGPATLAEYRVHRERRERQVLAAVEGGRETLPSIARAAYPEASAVSYPLAERNTHAILIKLVREGRLAREEDRYTRPRL